MLIFQWSHIADRKKLKINGIKRTSAPKSNLYLLDFHLDLSLFDRRYQYLQEEEKTQVSDSSESQTSKHSCTMLAKIKFIRIAFHTKQLRFWMSWSCVENSEEPMGLCSLSDGHQCCSLMIMESLLLILDYLHKNTSVHAF